MVPLVLVGVLLLLLTCCLLGPPLLVRGLRRRELPEAMLGLALVGVGLLGLPLQVAARLIEPASSPWVPVLAGTGLAAGTVGMIAICVFTWRVFRPASEASRRICLALSAVLILTGLAQAVLVGLRPDVPNHWLVVAVVERCVALAWTGFECLAYQKRLRKQLRLGLTTPAVANRFFLAMIATFSGTVICMVATFLLVTGVLLRDSAWLCIVFALPAYSCAASLWLICLPPNRYKRWLDARACRATA